MAELRPLKKNYGLTPLTYIGTDNGKPKGRYDWIFYYTVLGSLILMLTFHTVIAKAMSRDKWINILKHIIYFIPLVVIIFYDNNYSTFSLRNIFNKMFLIPFEFTDKWNPIINYFLQVLGAYGIIQVLAQDFGVKTGDVQAEIFKIPVIQWLLFTSSAYVLLKNRSEAMIGATLYFILKNNVSNGKTKPVCFEDV
tara:strand:+ start:1377 stop:1961 length:585 start_codon:yes stop_codon:yes gene_type:complete